MRHALLAGLMLVAAPAAAEPQFSTMERADRESRVGAQVGLGIKYKGIDLGDATGFRGEIFGQFASHLRGGSAIGGYGHISFSHLFIDDADDVNGVADLVLGGFYVAGLGDRTTVTAHLGLFLPTASDSIEGLIANALAGAERNYDLAGLAPNTTWLKLGATLRTALGVTSFLQGDLAVDIAIDEPEGADIDPLIHLNLGVGTWLGQVALTGELAMTFNDSFGDNGDYLASLAIGLHFTGSAHPSVAYILAFADEEGAIAHLLSATFYASFL